MNRTGTRYTADEVAVCFYIARYGSESVGGLDAAAAALHRKEISCKVRNIVAMCSDYKICNVAHEFTILTGVSRGAQVRKTDFDIVERLAQKSQSELQDIIRPAFPGLRFSP
jgi:hypothetical protein